VAAVILPERYHNDEINDSKKVSIKKRELLYDVIVKVALDYAIIFIDPIEVDRLNPKAASIKGMKMALDELKVKPQIALIDSEIIESKVETKSIVKGDEKSISIAAASILAKVSRDRYMEKISEQYPQYHFAKHKGYGTIQHLKALQKFGPIKNFHRFSYKPIQKILNNSHITKTL
jgi:ribonuclease HII